MATKRTHERGSRGCTATRKNRAKNTCDMHADSAEANRVTQVAVTSEQIAIVAAASAWNRRRGAHPTAASLARAVEMTEPETWRALKSLERLGIVKWDRGVKVLRQPDGVFLPLVPAERASTLYFPSVGT